MFDPGSYERSDYRVSDRAGVPEVTFEDCLVTTGWSCEKWGNKERRVKSTGCEGVTREAQLGWSRV